MWDLNPSPCSSCISHPISHICNLQSTIVNLKSARCLLISSTFLNPQSEIRNPKSQICNPKSEIYNLKSAWAHWGWFGLTRIALVSSLFKPSWENRGQVWRAVAQIRPFGVRTQVDLYWCLFNDRIRGWKPLLQGSMLSVGAAFSRESTYNLTSFIWATARWHGTLFWMLAFPQPNKGHQPPAGGPSCQ